MSRSVNSLRDGVPWRDASAGRRMDWRVWRVIFWAFLAAYAIAISIGLFFDGHRQYKSLCIAIVAIDGVLLVCFVAWAFHLRTRLAATCKAVSDSHDDAIRNQV